MSYTSNSPRRAILIGGIPLLGALLLAVTGCGPEPAAGGGADPGVTYSTQGLARQLSFRLQGIAKGIPGVSTGGPSRRGDGPSDGLTPEQRAEEDMLNDIVKGLRTIKSTPLEESTADLIAKVQADPELTDEQKQRVCARIEELVAQPAPESDTMGWGTADSDTGALPTMKPQPEGAEPKGNRGRRGESEGDSSQ